MPLFSLPLIVFHSVFIAGRVQRTCVLLDIYDVSMKNLNSEAFVVFSSTKPQCEAFKFVELSKEKLAWAFSRSKSSKDKKAWLKMTRTHS